MNNLKLTVYFTSVGYYAMGDHDSALKSALKKRNDFFEINRANISEIAEERLDYYTAGPHLFAVITLSYFNK